MTAPSETELPPAPAPAEDAAAPANALAAVRAELDRLDDELHELVRQRAAVVARLAASRAKAAGTPLRPGREAQILRRLLANHSGPLPRAALIRFWRELLSSSSLMQGNFNVALYARTPAVEQLAREHFGLLTPLRSHPTPARALAAVAAGEAAVAVLPLPEEAEPQEAAWWTSLDSPRLQVVARLPFWAADQGPEALAVAPVPPDPSGHDRTLLRLEASPDRSRTQLVAALTAAGLPPRSLQLQRHGPVLRALAEVDGVVAADDPRLAALPVERALPLGFYAVPERGE